jgi:hypothetical protein
MFLRNELVQNLKGKARLMQKTCEVCGRKIKTGYKYCWEHRHTSQAEALRGDRQFKKAEKFYYQRALMLYFMLGLLLFFISMYTLLFNVYVFLALFLIALVVIFYPIVFKNKILESEKCEDYITQQLQRYKEKQERKNRIKDRVFR